MLLTYEQLRPCLFVDISLEAAGKLVFPWQEVFTGSDDRFGVSWSYSEKSLVPACFINITLLFAMLINAVLTWYTNIMDTHGKWCIATSHALHCITVLLELRDYDIVVTMSISMWINAIDLPPSCFCALFISLHGHWKIVSIGRLWHAKFDLLTLVLMLWWL